MGGNGSYYDRDVVDKMLRNVNTGVTSATERELQQSSMDPGLLPRNRRLLCASECPLVYDFDVTGSMDNLPKIIYDKWPGIVGQIVARGYLNDPEMSITATGDVRSDRSPLQMCDFSPLRNLDKWLKRIHFEGRGGGQGSESYEMNAYFYVNFCDMPKAKVPIYLITGDEACVSQLYGSDLKDHFGGEHDNITARVVFAQLLEKFGGNVFRIQRKYTNSGIEGWTNDLIVQQWESLLGKERIIHLPEDLAIGDITLGIYAIVSGARTLSEYIEDMQTRPLDLAENIKYEPQSPERIRQVEKALQPLAGFKSIKTTKSSRANPGEGGATSSKKTAWKV